MKDLIEKVNKLAEMASELKQQIQGEGQSDTNNGQPGADSNKINWELMPVNTLIVNDYGDIRYFAQVVEGKVYVFSHGASSMTHGGREPLSWIRIPRLAKNQPWRPWFGGECPVDPRVVVDYALRDSQSGVDYTATRAGNLQWKWGKGPSPTDIIAWRIADKQEKDK